LFYKLFFKRFCKNWKWLFFIIFVPSSYKDLFDACVLFIETCSLKYIKELYSVYRNCLIVYLECILLLSNKNFDISSFNLTSLLFISYPIIDFQTQSYIKIYVKKLIKQGCKFIINDNYPYPEKIISNYFTCFSCIFTMFKYVPVKISSDQFNSIFKNKNIISNNSNINYKIKLFNNLIACAKERIFINMDNIYMNEIYQLILK